jgi:prolipoprotein diacylglyceryl transferase
LIPAFIPSPSQSGFNIGPLFVHAYGLMYVLAVGASVLITRRRWRAAGEDPELVYEVAMWAFPAGLIGGRIYFLITTPSQIPPHWWGPFAIWKGGLGIWGGIAGGAVVGLWVLYRRLSPVDVRRFMDAAAPALLVAQAFGRVGNYFNQELFGGPTTLPWGLKIDPAHRPPGYAHFATFQPTFLYEIIWNLSLAGFLVWLGHHRRIRPPGLFALYVAGYSGFRIFEETLRVDYSNHIFGLRLNFFVATVLCIAGLVWFVAIQRQWPAPAWFPRRRARADGSSAAARRSGQRRPKPPAARPASRAGADTRSGRKAGRR